MLICIFIQRLFEYFLQGGKYRNKQRPSGAPEAHRSEQWHDDALET